MKKLVAAGLIVLAASTSVALPPRPSAAVAPAADRHARVGRGFRRWWLAGVERARWLERRR